MEEVKVKIADQRMLRLMHNMLKVGHINLHDLSDSKLEFGLGISSSGILSPLFANI